MDAVNTLRELVKEIGVDKIPPHLLGPIDDVLAEARERDERQTELFTEAKCA